MEEINWPPSNWSEMSMEEQNASYQGLPEDLEIVEVDDEEEAIDPELDAWLKAEHDKLTPEQKARSAELKRRILAGEPLAQQTVEQPSH